MTEVVSPPARILAIDDDRLVRESICAYLEDSGFTSFQAASGGDGLRVFEEEGPDVVVCDLRMPDMDGLQVLEHLMRKAPDTPVIVLSGAGVVTDVVKALRLGACDYLVKPIADMAVLEHAINEALHKRQLESENARYRDELEAANRELNQHLSELRADQEAGRRAQIQLLPEPEAVLGPYRFSHTMLPSLYLSGDFLDYFEIDERYTGFYIADVSGHGSASAFVTMTLKSLMNQPLRRFRSQGEDTILHPAALLDWLNAEILHADLGKYLTLFYGVLDRESHVLRYANAGHFPHPVAVSGVAAEAIRAEGFPIGMFPWAQYAEHELTMVPPFRLAMFSDGLLDFVDGATVEQKLERLTAYCRLPHLSILKLRELLGLMRKAEPRDDVTLFLIERES